MGLERTTNRTRRDGTVASVIYQLPQQKRLDTGLQEISAVKPAGH